jgi:Ca2+-binding RTX toxin-like protein
MQINFKGKPREPKTFNLTTLDLDAKALDRQHPGTSDWLLRVHDAGPHGGAQYGDSRVSRDPQGHTDTQLGNGRIAIDGSIIIEGYSAGTLGLTMTGAVVDVNPVTITPAILGDLYANKNDTLYDTAGNDYIASGTGNDQVFASAGGSDIIDGGIGQDIVYGGLGNDVIFGGPDGDILVGENGNDRLYVNGQVTVADAIAAGNSQTETGGKGDWLAGGAAHILGIFKPAGFAANDQDYTCIA